MRLDPPGHWDVYEEHLDEAAFLWAQREGALASAGHVLADAAELEARLRAHLDGLVLGGAPVAERLLLPALAEEDAHRVAAAAFALIAERDDALGRVLAVLDEGGEAPRAGVQRALELSEREGLPERLLPLLSSAKPEGRAAALAVLAFRRVDPGPALTALLGDGAPRVRVCALRAARAAPGRATRDSVERALRASEREVRDEALEVGVLLGLRAAWSACVDVVSKRQPGCSRAMALLGMGGDAAELGLLKEALGVPGLRRGALWALGLSGRVSSAEACLPALWDEDEGVARLAAEAFCAITGLTLEGALLAEPGPEPAEPIALEREDLDAELAPAAEELLARANPEAVEAWWKKARGGFAPEGRLLYGKPFELGRVREVLARAPTRRRSALALELAIRSRGKYAIETREFVERQYKQLESLDERGGVRFAAPFKQGLLVD